MPDTQRHLDFVGLVLFLFLCLRVVILSVRVGMRTGPLTLSCFSLAPRTSSEHTFSRDLTASAVRVIRMRCTGSSSTTGLPVSALEYADAIVTYLSNPAEIIQIMNSAESGYVLKKKTPC